MVIYYMQISIEKRNAYTEVFEIINSMLPSDIEKIPPKLLDALDKNRNKEYKFRFDKNVSLERSKIIA